MFGPNAPQPDLDKLPPMLRLYLEYKQQYPDALLLLQVGDFYEAFFSDAVTLSQVLNLTLTSRDKNSDAPVPMCGVPIAAIDGYLERLVAQGYSAALVRQIGDPGAKKGMVERALERVVSPGVKILTSPDSDTEINLLCALVLSSESSVAIACADVKEGCVRVRESIALADLEGELRRLRPREIVVSKRAGEQVIDRRLQWVRALERVLGGERALKFRVPPAEGTHRQLSAVPGYSPLASGSKEAVRLLISYIDEATPGMQIEISEVLVDSDSDILVLDATTQSHLELIRNSRDGSRNGTLLGVLDQTLSAQGARCLEQSLRRPLAQRAAIEQRLAAVEYLKSNPILRAELRDELRGVVDFERVATRLELGAVTPRELGALRDGLCMAASISARLKVLDAAALETALGQVAGRWPNSAALIEKLAQALTDAPPLALSAGDTMRCGFNADLDRLRALRDDSNQLLTQLEERERSRTGIQSLKVRSNNVFGYYIEITRANLDKVPSDYIRKQTTANGERFVTDELRKLESEILGAQDKIAALERKLFQLLCSELLPSAGQLRLLGGCSAQLDVLLSLAQVAERDDLVRPQLDDSCQMLIEDGRHPVLARLMQGRFVPNSLNLTEQRCVVLTGPNMGGKSTYLRQAALIVIMAQLGSFVPARAAQIGIVDQIFTRIGASDNMLEGESTFMVEMREAAQIVTRATARSLLIVDEIGRGTATADGLALARAILEWIVENLKARTLFATHFHELTALVSEFPQVQNLCVGSYDRDGELVFTHQILQGPASRSYGLEVAQLAGMPRELIARARSLLTLQPVGSRADSRQLSMFGSAAAAAQVVERIREPADYGRLSQLRQRIEVIDVNHTTPLQALGLLQEIRNLVTSSEKP